MSARGPYRRHSQQFKMQLCTDIRDVCEPEPGQAKTWVVEGRNSRASRGASPVRRGIQQLN